MKKVLIILFIFSSLIASATDYYVKTGGNDGAAGTSDGTAWATIAKVNDFSQNTGFEPGDRIFFNRGNTFNIVHHVGGDSPYDDAVNNSQALRIQQSGTNGSPIVIGAYGTGDRPIINGRATIRGWNTAGNWTNTSGNIWRMTDGSIWWGEGYQGRGRLWIDGTEVKMGINVGAPTATEPYNHSVGTENYLYIYSVGNPATTFTSMEDQGWSNNVIQCYQVNYQTIQNLDLRGCVHGIGVSGSDNIIIEDCNIGLSTAMQGVFVDGDDYTGSTNSNNGIIRRCTLETGDTQTDNWWRQNTEDGILIRSSCDNWRVYENTVSNWSHACIGIYAIEGYPVTNIYVYDNTVTAPNVDYSIGIVGAAGVGDFTNIQIFSNTFYDIANEIQLDSKGIKFYNNIVDKINGVAWASGAPNEIYGNGISIEGSSLLDTDPEEIEIYNNTIVNCAGAGIIIRAWNAEDKKNNLIRNNILYNNNTAGDVNVSPTGRFQLKIEDEYPTNLTNTIKGNTYENNLFYYTGVTDLIFNGRIASNDYPATVTEFNSYDGVNLDQIANNIIGDSDIFVDFAGRDYHLAEGSLAIGAGVAVGLTYDKDSALYLATPSIGAYEYGSAPEDPDPPDLPVVVTDTATNVKSVVATLNGSATGTTITAKGFCWSTSINPSLSNSFVLVGTGEGDFTYNLSGLSGNTTYYIRSYATNSEGTVYGANISFTTPVCTQGLTNGKIGYTNGKPGVHK